MSSEKDSGTNRGAKRLKTLKGLHPDLLYTFELNRIHTFIWNHAVVPYERVNLIYEYICECWTKEPERFRLDPIHQMPGLNT